MSAVLTFFVVAVIPILHANVFDDDSLLYWRRSAPSECKPFTTFMISCNKCVCSAEGTAYCTRMICAKKTVTRLDQIKAPLSNEREDSGADDKS